MKVWSPLAIGLAAGAAGVLIAAGAAVYLKLRKKKDPVELERLRRLSLARTGRITSGEVTGLIEPEGESTALMLVYRYDISGVTYEVTQDVSMMAALAAEPHRLIGKGVSIKYEMKHPSNSIVISEDWSGIRGAGLDEPESTAGPTNSAETAEKI